MALADGTTLLCDHHKNSIETIWAALELAAELPGRKLLVITRMRFLTGELEPALLMTAKLLARVVDEMIVIGDGVKALVEAAVAEGLARTRIHQAAPGLPTPSVERRHHRPAFEPCKQHQFQVTLCQHREALLLRGPD